MTDRYRKYWRRSGRTCAIEHCYERGEFLFGATGPKGQLVDCYWLCRGHTDEELRLLAEHCACGIKVHDGDYCKATPLFEIVNLVNPEFPERWLACGRHLGHKPNVWRGVVYRGE